MDVIRRGLAAIVIGTIAGGIALAALLLPNVAGPRGLIQHDPAG
jgi:hypothetical protein